jgi:pimeloyl-ACP methyl ester carboxylesterase
MLINTFHFFPKKLRKPLLEFKKVRLGVAATDDALKEKAAHMSLYSWSEENMYSEFIIMRNSGHLAKWEATDRFNLLLRKFLNRHNAVA